MEVLVQPLNRVIQVEPGANLLQALQAAQVPMSYSCMAGRCGTCRCRVIDGARQPPVDGADTYVLACQTCVTEACTVQIPEPDEIVVHPARTIKTTVVSIEDLTHDIQRLVLKPAKPIDYSPGNTCSCSSHPSTPGRTRWPGWPTTARWSFTSAVCPTGA